MSKYSRCLQGSGPGRRGWSKLWGVGGVRLGGEVVGGEEVAVGEGSTCMTEAST